MTPRERRIIVVLTVLIFAVLTLILTSACSDKAVIPQEVVTPSWTPRHESVPRFTSCEAARQAGAPLPLVIGDPGWNPRLDYDKNGVIC